MIVNIVNDNKIVDSLIILLCLLYKRASTYIVNNNRTVDSLIIVTLLKQGGQKRMNEKLAFEKL